MSFELVKEVVEVFKSEIHVVIEYEHGDADLTTYQTTKIMTENLDNGLLKLELFLDKFKEINSLIEDSRSYGTDLPDFFSDLLIMQVQTDGKNRLSIPVECDAMSDQSDYYAAMSIKSIFYYNELGEKFKVTQK